MTLSKHYEPEQVEARWRQFWSDKGYSHCDVEAPGEPYTIVLPPPNVTGSLHIGHGLGFTIQDTLIRYQRMLGKRTLWMPGTDHAGIATQMLVERDLNRKEKKTRYDIGRDAFLERMWGWKQTHGDRIVNQMKHMAFSLDWERLRFTMDEVSSKAVTEVFVTLHKQKLIYRANRLIHWCVSCQTALSDLEVVAQPEPGHLWEIAYPFVEGDGKVVVATTRPETMLGDTAIAVHPEDDRYRHLVGKMVRLPLTGREIPIVADTFVDPEFGSGAVKITPAHDANDFACGERLGLASLSVIDTDGTLCSPAPDAYVGLSVSEGRKQVLADLKDQGFLVSTKDHMVPKGRCDRCKNIVEPLLSKQWFVTTKPLAEPAIAAVKEGRTRFIPEHWTKTYMHWMTNIKDWCISRQLWWGHRIPAWYCGDCEETIVSDETPTVCTACGSGKLRQDEDVLDTWFSSALWPFSTLGWPERTQELEKHYSTDVLVTGPDIIFFWVARMMMMGLHFMKDVPFRDVYLTPIVTDENGDKMSKVKGNVIDPLDVVNGATKQSLLDKAEKAGLGKQVTKAILKNFPAGIPKAGTDALRFSLCAMSVHSGHIRLSLERVEGYRNFINKLWNASRFSFLHLEDFVVPPEVSYPEVSQKTIETLPLPCQWILSRLQKVTAEVRGGFTEYRFSEVANTLYHFVWGEFCDWFIELSKPDLFVGEDDSEDKEDSRKASQWTLSYVLENTLQLLHPICPFVTEEIWQKLPTRNKQVASIGVAPFPEEDPSLCSPKAEGTMEVIQSVVTAIRTIRSTYSVPPSRGMKAVVVAEGHWHETLANAQKYIQTLAKVEMSVVETDPGLSQVGRVVMGNGIEVFVPLGGLIDLEAEAARLQKAMAKTKKEIDFVNKKLQNPKFLDRAPKEVVEKEKEKILQEEKKLQSLESALLALG